MAIDLLNIQEHVVSKDLSGYITYIYGAPKTGKTTLAVQMPKTLLLAFERGYNALPGVRPQDVTSWGEMKQIMRELKKPAVKEMYSCIVVDTVDIAADMCSKYICNQLGIDNMGDGGWGTNSWKKFKDEFNDVFRGLAQLGYAVFFLGHHSEQTVKDKDGNDKIVIRPSLTPKSVKQTIEGMADIYGYAHQAPGHSMSVLTLRYPDDSISCGGRIKYLPNEIEMSYDNLVKAMADAIDKEAAEYGNKYVTEEREVAPAVVELNYDELMSEFSAVVGELMNSNQTLYAPKITRIIEKHLGKGKKMADATPDQVEMINLILIEIKEDLLDEMKKFN